MGQLITGWLSAGSRTVVIFCVIGCSNVNCVTTDSHRQVLSATNTKRAHKEFKKRRIFRPVKLGLAIWFRLLQFVVAKVYDPSAHYLLTLVLTLEIIGNLPPPRRVWIDETDTVAVVRLFRISQSILDGVDSSVIAESRQPESKLPPASRCVRAKYTAAHVPSPITYRDECSGTTVVDKWESSTKSQ